AALVVLAVVVALIRKLPPRAGTLALDRHHNLHDRLTNALAFSALPKEQRTALMEVAIDDACEHGAGLKPGKASPIGFPRDFGVSLAVAAGVAAVALLEVRVPRREVPMAATIDALVMSEDDLEIFREAAKELAKEDQNPEMKAAVDQFNQLIEDIANKRLDRTEAFRRMEAIERELLTGAEADLKALEDALKETGLELKKSDLAKKVGESLEKKDLEKTKKELKDLANQLRDKKKKPSKAEIEKLKQALAKAAAQRKEALAAINEKRAELREELLQKKNKKQQEQDGGPKKDDEEEKLLKKKERELERLDREAEQKERTGRQLDKLDRELAKAAEDLMRDLGMSAEDLEQAAEDLNRMQQEEMSQKEKEELRQRLQELRELLRQQGQGGKQQLARLLKFGKRARGGQGQQGQGQQGQGQGQQGQGQQWVIGPGGKKVLVPGGGGQQPGEGQGQGQQGQGQGQGQGQDGNGSGQGKGVGSGRGGEVAGNRTDPKMGTTDVQAQAVDTQEGPSNSEVILSAAERGFKGKPYKKVYTDYRTVAEQQINKDKIPDGYRFYVHRYFQLIRPRE
ncbi:MAG TPA: hypothetical protein VK459_07700, partial [Polyangiaceae bacterium]|nr:hypothetical protein [Polyangiaceae bacterium]